MIVPEKMSLSDFVTRRLHPVKVTISLLRHELAHNSKADTTQISKYLLSSAVSTLELFVEDYERLVSAAPRVATSSADRKFVEDPSKSGLLPQ